MVAKSSEFGEKAVGDDDNDDDNNDDESIAGGTSCSNTAFANSTGETRTMTGYFVRSWYYWSAGKQYCRRNALKSYTHYVDMNDQN